MRLRLHYYYIALFQFSSVSCFLDGVALTGYNLTTTTTANVFDCQIDCQVVIRMMILKKLFKNVWGSFHQHIY